MRLNRRAAVWLLFVLAMPVLAWGNPPTISPYAGQVTINEIQLDGNNALEFVELYFLSSINTDGWQLVTNGPGGSATGSCELSDGTHPAGTYLILEGDCLGWHDNQREIYLLDDQGQLVHFISLWHSGNQSNQGAFGDPDAWDEEYQSVTTNLNDADSNLTNYCAGIDGETNDAVWNPDGSSCESTRGDSNAESLSLVAHYRLDSFSWDGSAGEVIDSSEFDNHGTARNGLQTDNGQVCRGAWFRGQGYNTGPEGQFVEAKYYIDVSHDDSLSTLSPRGEDNDIHSTSITGWFRADDTNATRVILHKGEGGASQEYQVLIEDNRLRFRAWDSNGSPSVASISDEAIIPGKWYFFSLIGQRGGGDDYLVNARLYDQSGQIGTSNTTVLTDLLSNYSDKPTAGRLFLGAESFGSDPVNYFDGIVDEVRIYEGAISVLQIEQNQAEERDCSQTTNPELTCVNQAFGQPLGDLWQVDAETGTFEPQAADGRLLLTEDSPDQLTLATLQRAFPTDNNRIEIEFDYYAWSPNGGDGGEGLAVVLSNAAVDAQPGGGADSLGYANRNAEPGFAGGWLGVGLDARGRFATNLDGRNGGFGYAIADAVSVRGSAASGYQYLQGSNTLTPGLDVRGTSTAGPGHRYRIVYDTLTDTQLMSVERDTGSGFQYIVPPFEVQQTSSPENLKISFTGSTSSFSNFHAIDNLQVCSSQSGDIDDGVDHYRFNLTSTNGLTCAPSSMTIDACTDDDCDSQYASPFDVELLPESGWVNGSSLSDIESGDTLHLTRNTNDSATIDIESSSPAATSADSPRCYVGDTQVACTINFFNEGLLLVDSNAEPLTPNHIAGVAIESLLLRAVRRDEDAEPNWQNSLDSTCVAIDAPIERSVDWSAVTVNPGEPFGYDAADPEAHERFSVYGTSISTTPDADKDFTVIDMTFNDDGEASVSSLQYDDVGHIELQAKTGLEIEVDGETETRMVSLINTGPYEFRPAGFGFDKITCEGNIEGGHSSGATASALPRFCRAGEDFTATIQVLNGNGEVTRNFGNETTIHPVTLSHTLVAPSTNNNPDLTNGNGEAVNILSSNFSNGIKELTLGWPEVGVITLDARMNAYLSWEANGGTPIVGDSGDVGRFVPDRFSVKWSDDVPPEFLPAAGSYTYQGQEFNWRYEPKLEIEALNTKDDVTRNYGDDGDSGQNFFSLTRNPQTSINNTSAAIHFSKLSDGGDELTAGDPDDVASVLTGYDTYDGRAILNITENAVWEIGKVLEFDNADQFPQPLEVRLHIQSSVFTDQDGVFWPNSEGDPQGLSIDISNGELIYGRLALKSGQSPATSPLRMPLRVEHWEAREEGEPEGRFRVFAEETDNAYFGEELSQLFTFSPQLTDLDYVESESLVWSVDGVEYTNPPDFSFLNAKADLVIRLNLNIPPDESAPTGRVVVTGGTAIPIFLRHPWPHANEYPDEDFVGPRAIASFGTYEGRPPVLFMLPQGR